MIQGFEEQTAPLSQDERYAVGPLAEWLRTNCRSERNAAKNEEMQLFLEEMFPNLTFGGARIRKMLNHIRRNRLVYPLVSTSKGYWIGTNDELIVYLDSLEQRISAIQAVRDSFDRPDSSQLGLFS